ncbi:NAD(P)-binding protein [Streptomyces sp. enrichment culture]|uniref:NAD(P)-binding protein n=1 Tax=Streptomyces sp. enrichment culture TaxID=1795815 RepID=UPI003F55E50C
MSRRHRDAPDTVVAGAGLAGPACAPRLCRTGPTVALPESSDGVGGRTRSRHRAELYGADTSGRQRIAVHPVHGALPAMVPPWPPSRSTRVAPGRHVCGDHRPTGGVQDALASGVRAAREPLADPASG